MDAIGIIAVLGEPKALAKRLDVPANHVHTWKKRNKIPAHMVPRVAAVAAEVAPQLTPAAFDAQLRRRARTTAPAQASAL